MSDVSRKNLMQYLEGDVESFLLVNANVPLLRGPSELTLVHAERQHYLRALGYLRIGAY